MKKIIKKCPKCYGFVLKNERDGEIMSTSVSHIGSVGIICPICGHKLVKKSAGMVCKNWKCPLYWKLKKGWAYNNESF